MFNHQALCAFLIPLAVAVSLAPLANAEQATDALKPGPVSLIASPTQRLLNLRHPQVIPAACCKVCRKGKACGDSCISKAKSCNKGTGCACNG